ncbi:STY0301 family protein [Legionella sp. CNM-1927-20]|uniref:STY0301 family protein n=1 Tax=Legionella sp. CNM-1927-20 TaxID=3422221 RepID=UPI00403AC391
MKELAWITILLIGGIILSSNSLAHTINCPKIIKSTQTLKDKLDGWEAYLDVSQTEHPFSHITFYAGHPSENASLAPNNQNIKINMMIWRFQGNNFWVACNYRGTAIQLIQRLPKKTKICSVIYNKDNSIKSIFCNG